MKPAKHSFKRYLAFLLALLLVMSNISVTAYAEDTTSVPDDEIIIAQEETLSDPENDAFSDFETFENENAEPSDTEIFDEEAEDSSAEQSLEDDLIEETLEETVSDDQESDIIDAASENEDAGTDEDSIFMEDEGVIAPEMPAFSQSVKMDVGEVSVYAPEGVFPEDALLSVEMLPADTQEAADAAVDPLRDTEREIAASYTFDIKVLAANEVTVLEPADDTKVRILFSLAEVSDQNLETAVYSIRQDKATGALSAQAMDLLAEKAARDFPISYDPAVTAAVETDGFDYYYTVEFTKSRQENESADDLQGELQDNEQSVIPGSKKRAMTNNLLTASADDGKEGDIPVYIIDDVTGAFPTHGTVTLPGYHYYGVGATIPYQVSKGDTVTVEAVPEADYSVAVSVGYIPASGYTEKSLEYDEGTNTFTVPSRCVSITLHVTFAKEQEEYSVETRVASNDLTGNTISADKEKAAPGDLVTVTLGMKPGTEMESLRLYKQDDNTLVDPQPAKVDDTTYTFSMPSCDVYLFAEFIFLDYNVSVADTGSITESGFEVSVDKSTAHYGDTVTMTVSTLPSSPMMNVTPLAYYEADGEQISLPLSDAGDGTYTFTMPEHDVTVTAVASFDGYTITIVNLDKDGNPLDAFHPQIYLSAKTYLGTYREIAGEEVKVNVESNYTEDSKWGTYDVYYTWEEDGETKSSTISDLSFDEWLNARGSFVMPAGNVTIYVVLEEAYFVNVENNEYGGVVCDVRKAFPGTEITVTATVTNNTYSNLIWTIEPESLEVTVPEGLPNTRTFIMPSETVYFKVDFTMEPVSYVERTWNGSRVVEEEKELLFYNQLTSANSDSITINDESWDGWYVVQGTVDLERLTTQGEVHMVLNDGARLNSNKTVIVSSGSTCTIYGQAADSGMLYAHPGDGPGISGDGALIIQGGAIDAKGASERAGIGGGIGSNQNLSLTINGGTVTAAGGNKGAGIGGGCYDDGKGGRGGQVIIHGGIVNATGGSNGAGIGGAYQGVAGTVTITGGTVTAKGGYLAAGIGGGYLYTKHQSNGNSQSITISGGVVYADVSGNEAAAIGGGCGSNSGTILITGGYIEAKAGSSASVIGAGNGGDCNVIRIEGGTIVATSVEFGNAIGRYYGGDAAGTVTIYDNARVTAGKSASTAEVAAANNRVNACRNSIYVKIEPCAHDLVYTYTITDTTHTKVCAHCLTSLSAHDHDIDDLGVCTVCGYQDETNYVTFDANGGSGTMEGICYVPGRQVILPMCSFTAPEGMGFGGWQVGEDPDLKAENEIILPSGDVTIKAVWKYLITIRETENGRIIAEPEIASAGDTVTLTALPSDGYVLDELTVKEQHGGSFKTTQNEDGSCSFTMPDCEVFVDANFREIERYTVTFDSNGGSEVESQTVASGAKAAKPEDPTKEGFTFKGWYQVTATDPETLAEEAFDFENTAITGDITLKAVWAEPLKLAVYSTDTACSGSVANVAVAPEKESYSSGDSVTVTAEEKEGYSFLGWYTVTGVNDSQVTGYGDKLAETLAYTFDITKDTQITAVYEAKGKATIKIIAVNGAKYMVGDDTTIKTGSQENVPIGTTLKLTAADADQVFQWQNESEKILGTGSTLEYYVTSNTTITLVYQYDAENQSYVQFVSDYGQVLSYNQYSVSSTIDFPVSPTKYGYTFDKWVFEGTEDEATAETIKAKIGTEKIITLKPKYTKDEAVGSVTVNYKAGDTEIAEASVTADIPVGNTKTFAAQDIDRYTFECWKSEDGTVLGYKKDYFMQVTRDHLLNACYVADGEEVETAKPTIVITELATITSGQTHKISCIATRSLPEGYALVEQGMLFGVNLGSLSEETFIFGTSGVYRTIGTDLSTNGFTRVSNKVSSDSTVIYYRGYMVVRNDKTGEEEYYYSTIESGSYTSLNQ